MIRTANKTIQNWSSQLLELQQQAEVHLPVSQWSKGQLNPRHWDSQPIVYFLKHAYYGTNEFADTLNASRDARYLLRKPDNKLSVQATSFKAINDLRDDPESRFQLLFRRCAPSGFANQAVISRPDVLQAFAVAKSAKPKDALAWLKTVTNAWCTTTRMHEPIKFSCIFGCTQEKDHLGHYLQCHILWSIIHEVFQTDLPPHTYQRLNYSQPSLFKLYLISAIFDIYHALKIGLRLEVEKAQATSLYGEMYRISHKAAVDFRLSHPDVFHNNNSDNLSVWAPQPCSIPINTYHDTHIPARDRLLSTMQLHEDMLNQDSDSDLDSAASSEWDFPPQFQTALTDSQNGWQSPNSLSLGVRPDCLNLSVRPHFLELQVSEATPEMHNHTLPHQITGNSPSCPYTDAEV